MILADVCYYATFTITCDTRISKVFTDQIAPDVSRMEEDIYTPKRHTPNQLNQLFFLKN